MRSIRSWRFRPDRKPDHLGLTVFDELQQRSLMLRYWNFSSVRSRRSRIWVRFCLSFSKTHTQHKHVTHRWSKRTLDRTRWSESQRNYEMDRIIEELHRKRPPPKVDYTVNAAYPTHASLAANSRFAQRHHTSSADMDMTLEEFSRVACGLLDIPVEKSFITVICVVSPVSWILLIFMDAVMDSWCLRIVVAVTTMMSIVLTRSRQSKIIIYSCDYNHTLPSHHPYRRDGYFYPCCKNW